MLKSRKLRFISIALTIVALIVGISVLVWNFLLDNHTWNHIIFRQNHYVDGIIGALSCSILCVVLFLICFCILKNKSGNRICKVFACITFGLYNAAAIGTIIITVVSSLNLSDDYADYRLDCQLASEDISKFHEAVDSVIARSRHYDIYNSYNQKEINEYMMKAARSGYAPAQNYAGVYFHEKAKGINNHIFGNGKWNNTEFEFCKEELNRATYWWLKAAAQNYGVAQENLGRLKMNDLLSDQPYNFGEARYWLTEATKNGVTSAYYYLGLLYRDSSLLDAARYWSTGAERGNEDCRRMLENPDFIDISVNP